MYSTFSVISLTLALTKDKNKYIKNCFKVYNKEYDCVYDFNVSIIFNIITCVLFAFFSVVYMYLLFKILRRRYTVVPVNIV